MRIVRQNGEEYEVRTVEEKDYPVTELRDGDVVTVGAILNRFTNKVEIKGAVYRPDIYELDGEVNTVRALIDQAEGSRRRTDPLIEDLQNRLLSGQITWGQYNSERRSLADRAREDAASRQDSDS